MLRKRVLPQRKQNMSHTNKGYSIEANPSLYHNCEYVKCWMPPIFPKSLFPHNSFLFGPILPLNDSFSLLLPKQDSIWLAIAGAISSMAKNEHMLEDDYIDMDISSTTILRYSKSSPPHSIEFEFQMSFNQLEKETTTSPADELFYKGKLLPLHLPPRLQMVQKLLQNSTNTNALEATMPPSFKSCSISEKFVDECSAELTRSQARKFWCKKINLIRQSSLGLKLKASKAYLKSLFTTKSECSDSLQSEKKNTFSDGTKATTLMRSIERDKLLEEECIVQRKSFSGAINCQLMIKSSLAISSASSSSSSSFSSVHSNGLCGSHMLTRSSSLNSEMESSILGAIAYCKKTQVGARKSDIEFCPLSASKIAGACENQERLDHCTG